MIIDKTINLSANPGVYKMLDANADVIYVGKAKNLKKRVSQYFNKNHSDNKTKVLVANIKDFEVIVTATETQALLLESDLIKQYKPRYNILLKDSKSYPYICITNDKHPRAGFYRGNREQKYKFFGPFPSAYLVRNSLIALKKIFKVRQCSNSFYKSRSRPCLEYQIGLCSAPCVGKISDINYAQDVDNMSLFLQGKSKKTLAIISQKMQDAAKAQEFEIAAYCRDQLIELRAVQERHSSLRINDVDVISVVSEENIHAVEVLFVRQGKQIGQQCIFPKNSKYSSEKEVLSAFLPLYYFAKKTPNKVILSHKLDDKKLIEQALKIKIIDVIDKDKKHFLDIASLTAKENLRQKLLSKFRGQQKLYKLQQLLNLAKLPNLMECFDISHTMGEATVASCVVFENGSPKKSKYRQFNIANITKGDDYAAIEQAVHRRYSSLHKQQVKMPDIIFIDGGIGQLRRAIMVIDSIGIDSIQLVGIAKGEGRKAGLETIITIDDNIVNKINLPAHDMALLLINNIRDEAHRFAIKNHRKKRAKNRQVSILESVAGVGKIKRTAILNYFGGLQGAQVASIEELQKVDGINLALATKIAHIFRK